MALIPSRLSEPPTESKGHHTQELASLPLAGELPGLESFQLRMAMATIEPGGHTRAHGHRGVSETVYVMQGTATILDRLGDDYVVREYHVGDSFVGDHSTYHWFENRGTEALVIVFTQITPLKLMPGQPGAR